MAAEEEALRSALASGRFLAGADNGRWRLIELSWPHLFVGISARDGREYVFRLDCAGYPHVGPTGSLWDRNTGTWLAHDKWPRGGRLNEVFKPGWKGGQALYLPCDRSSIAGHDAWFGQYAALIWRPERGITLYLEAIHELLHSRDYVAGSA